MTNINLFCYNDHTLAIYDRMASMVTNEVDEDMSDTSSKIEPEHAPSARSSRRRCSYKREITEVIKDAMDSQITSLHRISSWPDRKNERDTARRKLVVEDIEEMAYFDERDKTQLLKVLLADMHQIETFLSMPMSLRKIHCMHLLGRNE